MRLFKYICKVKRTEGRRSSCVLYQIHLEDGHRKSHLGWGFRRVPEIKDEAGK